MPKENLSPESMLSPEVEEGEGVAEIQEKVKKIADDLENIDKGTRIALSRLAGDKRKIGEEPKNKIDKRESS